VTDEELAAAAKVEEAQARLALAATYMPGPAPWLAVSEAVGAWVYDITGKKYLDFGAGAQASVLGHCSSTPAHLVRDHLNHYLYPGSPADVAADYTVRYAHTLSSFFSLVNDLPQQVLVCSGVPEARQVIRQLTAGGGIEIRPASPGGLLDGGVVQDLVHQARGSDKLVVFNETLSGFGRTGKFLGSHHYDLAPDIVLLGPSGGGGLPFAAVVAPVSTFERALELGPYLTSPLACAAALGVLSHMTEDLFTHVTEMGALLERSIMEVSAQFSSPIREVTGTGLLRQVMLENPMRQDRFLRDCRSRGLILGSELTLTPPLTILADEISYAADMIADVLVEWDL
jgi:4-aminobutyrate aminotransferase-like enzyme